MAEIDSVARLIGEMRERGVRVELGRSAPTVTPGPGVKIRAEDIATLKEHRGELIAALQREEMDAVRRAALGGVGVPEERLEAVLVQDRRADGVLGAAEAKVTAAGANVRRFWSALLDYRAAWDWVAKRAAVHAVPAECVCAGCGTREAEVFLRMLGGVGDLRQWFLCSVCWD